jgi:hypothetical protein
MDFLEFFSTNAAMETKMMKKKKNHRVSKKNVVGWSQLFFALFPKADFVFP